MEVETAWDKFKVLFHSVLDMVAPVKAIRLKQRTEPWMTSKILHDIRHRDDVLNRFRKTRDSDLYRTFYKLRNKIQRETEVAKRDNLANKIEENANNPKRLWNQLKQLGYSTKGKQSTNIIVLDYDGETYFDPKKVANCFNNFYTTTASNLVEKLPSPFNLFHTDSPTFQEFHIKKCAIGSILSDPGD